jgi:hypothetical protein
MAALDPDKIEVLVDSGQVGMSVSADYSETLYTAEFGDGNVAFAQVGIGFGLRAYTFTWQQTYGFSDPALVQGKRWDGTSVEGLQARPQYMWRFHERRFSNFESLGNRCWIKDPVDTYYRLFRVLNQKPTFQQGDKYDRWSYSLEVREIRAAFTKEPLNVNLIAPGLYKWPLTS